MNISQQMCLDVYLIRIISVIESFHKNELTIVLYLKFKEEL